MKKLSARIIISFFVVFGLLLIPKTVFADESLSEAEVRASFYAMRERINAYDSAEISAEDACDSIEVDQARIEEMQTYAAAIQELAEGMENVQRGAEKEPLLVGDIPIADRREAAQAIVSYLNTNGTINDDGNREISVVNYFDYIEDSHVASIIYHPGSHLTFNLYVNFSSEQVQTLFSMDYSLSTYTASVMEVFNVFSNLYSEGMLCEAEINMAQLMVDNPPEFHYITGLLTREELIAKAEENSAAFSDLSMKILDDFLYDYFSIGFTELGFERLYPWVHLDKYSVHLKVGESTRITAYTNPEGELVSAYRDLSMVDFAGGRENGIAVATITALAPGRTELDFVITYGDYDYYATCVVDVEPAPGTYVEPFKDVLKSAYYADAVAWAVQEKVTSGTSKDTFSPSQNCTRGQVVTFLWRSAGSPEPKNKANPFTDVQEGKYYYKAVLWAVENQITSGLTSTTFGPDDVCTRAQVVTFLHRAKGKPADYASVDHFKDVIPGKYYYDAIRWAVKNKVTSGTSANAFSPNDSCTRGQIVTFLYRAR